MLQRKPKWKGRDGLCLSEGPLLPKHLNSSLPCSYKFKPVTPKRKTLHIGSSLVKFVAFSLHFIFSSHHCKQVRVNSCPSIHDTDSCFSFCPYMIPWEARMSEELCHGRTLQSIQSSSLSSSNTVKELGKEEEQRGSIESSLEAIYSYAEVAVTTVTGGAGRNPPLASSTASVQRTMWSSCWYFIVFQQLAPHPFYIK